MLTPLPRLLAAPMLLALMLAVIVAPQAHAASVSTWEELDSALRAGGSVTVAADITGAGVKISEDVPTTLDLAGHTVTLVGEPAVDLIGDAELTVTDSAQGGVLDASVTSFAASAAIGTYDSASALNEHAGALIVDGAVVRADASDGWSGAGIGGGSDAAGGIVIVHEGHVTAIGASDGAGIGGGDGGDGGEVTIHGGHVTASGGSFAAGIGGGYRGDGGVVTMTGGELIVQSGRSAAGIGGGRDGDGGHVSFEGGRLEATGSFNASAIGGGPPEEYKGTVSAGTFATDLGLSFDSETVFSGPWAAGISALGDAPGVRITNDEQPGNDGALVTVIESGAEITYNASGGAPAPDPEFVAHGSTASEPETPVRTGHTFTGWFDGEDPFDFSNPITEPMALAAGWTVSVYGVTFNSAGGSGVDPQEVEHGSDATRPTDPTRAGHDFVDWLLNGEPYDFSEPVTTDLDLVGSWDAHVYDVTFDSGGAGAVPAQSVAHGLTLEEPETPARQGHHFTGWYDGDDRWHFSSPVTGDMKLTAAWDLESYGVTFVAAGGTAVAAQRVEHGSRATQPANPTRAGYTFTGWFVDGKQFDFGTAVESDLTLTARWEVDAPAGPGPKPVTPVNLVDISSNPDSPHYTQFHREIQWLASTGVTKGWNMGDGRYEFRPKEDITREAMAAFMYRYAGSPKVVLPGRSPFTDVTPSNTNFYKEIVWMNQQGISTGWNVGGGNKEFRPKDDITRDAMAAFMYRFAGKPTTTPPAKSPFTDVSKSSQFYKEITWLSSTGISTGWNQGGGRYEYRPYDDISREAMAAFLFRFNNL